MMFLTAAASPRSEHIWLVLMRTACRRRGAYAARITFSAVLEGSDGWPFAKDIRELVQRVKIESSVPRRN